MDIIDLADYEIARLRFKFICLSLRNINRDTNRPLCNQLKKQTLGHYDKLT